MRTTWLVAALAIAPAAAAGGTFPAPPAAFDLPVSARSLGMGGAGGAAAWGEAPDVWANPALVTAARGLAWETGSMRIEPGGATDARSGGWSASASGWGLGAYVSRRRLEPGPGLEDTPVDAWAAGVSVAGIVDALRGRSRWRSGIASRADLAFGVERSTVHAPSFGGPLDGRFRGWGALARFTPLDLRRRDREGGGHQLDIAVAHAAHNDGHAALDNGVIAYPQPRVLRDAVGVRYAHRRAHGEGLAGSIGSMFNAGLDPVFELGLAWDVEHAPGLEVQRYGIEATLARVISLRTGYVDGTADGRNGATMGGGLALPLGQVLSARWDVSSEPPARGLSGPRTPRRSRNAFSVRLDPLAWRTPGGRP